MHAALCWHLCTSIVAVHATTTTRTISRRKEMDVVVLHACAAAGCALPTSFCGVFYAAFVGYVAGHLRWHDV